MNVLKSKESRLFILLGGFFITNALIAEFVGVKIFSLEASLGLEPWSWNFLGEKLSFNLTAGVVLWPIVFVMTDVINEYFGKRGVRFLSFLTVGLICFAFLMVFWSIRLVPADWWPQSATDHGVVDMQLAFKRIFGQGLWIIIGSLIAFLIGQVLDVMVFHKLKRITGDSKVWLRATGSTLVSQFIDSFVVLFIAFYIGADWKLSTVLAIGLNNYIYKFVVAIALTPAIYGAHFWIDRFLGKEKAEQLKLEAMKT
ncbi:MAG: queuosine precursor transporter [Bacteroidia bacterium]